MTSKIRSQELKIEKDCKHSSGCSFDQNFLEISQKIVLMISRSGSNMGHLSSKTRSQELKIEKSF
jgi:hypothetical protein